MPKCSVCGKEFNSKSALKNHCSATGHNCIQCPQCTSVFNSPNALQQHIKAVHKKEKKINCPECGKKFKKKSDFEQHFKSKHKGVVCPHCQKELKNQAGLKQHIESVHEFKCPHCSDKLYSRLLLQKHIEDKHKEKLKSSYICHTCKKVFKDELALKNHRSSLGHALKLIPNLSCPQCGKHFKDNNALKNHMSATGHKLQKGKAQSLKIKCPHCQKSFKSKTAMEQHVRMKHKKHSKIKAKAERIGLALFEKISLKDRVFTLFRKLLKKRKIVIMDECVGNDNSVVRALENQYLVRPLPKDLLGHSDRDLRLAFAVKNWGLVSKDYEMVMLAREMKIKPVYLLTEKRDHRDLIRISKLNYKIS